MTVSLQLLTDYSIAITLALFIMTNNARTTPGSLEKMYAQVKGTKFNYDILIENEPPQKNNNNNKKLL